MLNRPGHTPHTDDRTEAILTDFLHEAGDHPTYAQVTEWCRRYPEAAEAITHLAATLAVMDATAVDPETLPRDEAAEARGVAIAMRLHRELAPATLSPPLAFPGILAAARERDLTPAQLVRATDTSPMLLSKLDARQITPGTVPNALIALIAQVIGRAKDAVQAYLAGPPQPASATMAFHADGPPQPGATQDFRDALRDDPRLPPAARARWETAE